MPKKKTSDATKDKGFIEEKANNRRERRLNLLKARDPIYADTYTNLKTIENIRALLKLLRTRRIQCKNELRKVEHPEAELFGKQLHELQELMLQYAPTDEERKQMAERARWSTLRIQNLTFDEQCEMLAVWCEKPSTFYMAYSKDWVLSRMYKYWQLRSKKAEETGTPFLDLLEMTNSKLGEQNNTEIQKNKQSEIVSSPPIDKWEKKILEHLNTPGLQNLVTIATNTNLSRKTVGKYVNKLITYGYVIRPNGDRKGATITEKGKEYLSQSQKYPTIIPLNCP